MLTVTLAAYCVAPQHAQAPDNSELTTRQTEPTFMIRAQRNLILVRVIVRDAQGKPVADLNKDDFRLFDDKKPQVISHFSVEASTTQLPALAKPTVERSKEIVEKAPAAAPAMPQRYTALFFDDYHLASGDLTQTREAAARYLTKTLRPGDRAGIFTASGQGNLDFTDDRDKLLQSLSRLNFESRFRVRDNCPDLTPYHSQLLIDDRNNENDALAVATAMTISCICQNILPCPGAEDYARGQARRILDYNDESAEYTLTALENLVRRMEKAPGQRTIAFVSDGFLNRNRQYRVDQMVDRALRSNVTINSLDARGLYTIVPGGDASTRGAKDLRMALLSSYATLQRDSVEVDAEVLDELADGTGGIFVHNTNDYEGGFERIGALPEIAYMLGFSPQNLEFNGRFHTLKVSLVRQTNFTLQARRGYFAPSHVENAAIREREELDQEVFSRDETSELPIRIQTQFFKVDDLNAKFSVLVHADLHSVQFRKQENRNLNNLTLVIALFDRDGNYVIGKQQTLEMHLRDATLDRLRSDGITLKTEFDMKPGTYLVRIVLEDSESQQLSALSRSVEIPY